jgi:NTP pyrophosphatase (non-canonical NTP hydrolase)
MAAQDYTASRFAVRKGNTMKRELIFDEIRKERDRQDAKWGPLPRNLSDMIWLTVIIEEVGEVAQAILKQDWMNLKDEVIQVIAVCVAYLEDDENHENGLFKIG